MCATTIVWIPNHVPLEMTGVLNVSVQHAMKDQNVRLTNVYGAMGVTVL